MNANETYSIVFFHNLTVPLPIKKSYPPQVWTVGLSLLVINAGPTSSWAACQIYKTGGWGPENSGNPATFKSRSLREGVMELLKSSPWTYLKWNLLYWGYPKFNKQTIGSNASNAFRFFRLRRKVSLFKDWRSNILMIQSGRRNTEALLAFKKKCQHWVQGLHLNQQMVS